MIVMTPSDENECRRMLYTAYLQDSPTAVRYPRGTGVGRDIDKAMRALTIGEAKLIRQGRKIAFLVFGSPVHDTLLAAEELDASVVNMRFVKPLDKDMVLSMVDTHDVLVTVEDNVVTGGAGSAVNELLANAKLNVKTLNLGLPDRFMNHGSREQLLSEAGLDAKGIVASVSHLLPQGDCGTTSSKVVSK